MDKFKTHSGSMLPLRRSNVDTDQIIPAVYLKRVTRNGFEDGLFAAWRSDPDFILNQPQYRQASILVSGPEFGTGSSREHAVWALQNYGFAVVISPRFADIFRGNSLKGGLLTITLDEQVVGRMWDLAERDPSAQVTVDLENKQVRFAEETQAFEIDDYARWRMMEGLDDVGLTLRHTDSITSFEQSRPTWSPTTTPV